MIEELKDIPNGIIGFRTTGKISQKQFDAVVLPAVDELLKRTDKLNFLLIVETDRQNSSISSWLKNAMITLNNARKWNRAAIVIDHDNLDIEHLSKTLPGKFKRFTLSELSQAIAWANEPGGTKGEQIFAKEGERFD